jgi:pyridoxamine 5'-phosphate oxidase
MKLADIRTDYKFAALNEADVAADPIAQFEKWLNEAIAAQLPEPNAMTVATADAAGKPSARIVLIKGVDARGFVFYTNYASRKGHDIDVNPQAALLFHWTELERQVRIEGRVEQVSAAESDAYYFSRPLGSRIGAWASPQSEVIASREALETAMATQEASLGLSPPRPPHWGGLRVVPDAIEFWQGRSSRLHDRLRYVKTSDGWRLERLAP